MLTGTGAWLSFLLSSEKSAGECFNGWSAATWEFHAGVISLFVVRGINVPHLYWGWKTARFCENLVPIQHDVSEVTRVLMNSARTRISFHFVAVGGVHIGQTLEARKCSAAQGPHSEVVTRAFWRFVSKSCDECKGSFARLMDLFNSLASFHFSYLLKLFI